MVRRLLPCVLLVVPALFGADKSADNKMLEILRDVGVLQEQMKALQRSLEAKLADLGQAGAEQARAAGEAGKSTAALGDRLQKSLQDQQDQQLKILATVAAVGAQVEAVSSDLNTMRTALNDLTGAMARLSTQVSDLNNALKSVQTSKPDAAGDPPRSEISATDLFSNAEGDRLGGKLALALQEYAQFVARFGDTGQAPDAQYYIGSIHYSNQEWDDSVKSFDVLLQTHPESKRVPEALYYKADALARLGRAQEAAETLKDLRKRFPDNPLAKRSLTVKPPAHF
jgi:TolA-binding protein